MKLTYDDGREADDPFFDQPVDDQRWLTAMAVCFDPRKIDERRSVLDDLIALRRRRGVDAFYDEIRRRIGGL